MISIFAAHSGFFKVCIIKVITLNYSKSFNQFSLIICFQSPLLDKEYENSFHDLDFEVLVSP